MIVNIMMFLYFLIGRLYFINQYLMDYSYFEESTGIYIGFIIFIPLMSVVQEKLKKVKIIFIFSILMILNCMDYNHLIFI